MSIRKWSAAVKNFASPLVALCLCLAVYILRLSLPKTKGTITLEGLSDTVEIIRDEWGVPHISARTRRDLFFAEGFVHAQDRLWQLELQRRTASGTLSEIVGEKGLVPDRFMRRMGLRRNAKAQIDSLPNSIRADLAAYSEGINAYISTTPWWRLPIEFILLGTRPAFWTPLDSAAIVKLIGFVLAPNWDTQIVRLWLIEYLGADTAANLEPKYVDPELITPPPGVEHTAQDLNPLGEYAEIVSWIPRAGASNTWAVDGTKSASGAPILANDTHTPASLPALWYEVHLRDDTTHAAGVSIPGLPGIIAGHNEHITWGISSGMVNQQDLFVELFDPDKPTMYWYEDQWHEATMIRETILVKGRPSPAYEDILITRHGPIISPLIAGEKRALALKSVVLEHLDVLIGASEIMAAHDWQEFSLALQNWSAPSLNFVYADREGHIGWRLAGFIPVRPNRSGLVPGRGWLAQAEWEGYLPFEQMPSAYDPPSHIVAAANNKPSTAFPVSISGEWADSYRIQRIKQLLEQKNVLTPEDFRKIQGDIYSKVASELLEFMLRFETKDKKLTKILEELRLWDFRVKAKSSAAAIFEVFAYRLYYNVFAEKLGKDIDLYMGKGIHVAAHINALGYRAASNLMRILRSLPDDWFSPDAQGNARTLGDVIEHSLREAIVYLEQRMGKNRKRWQWGKIHTVTFPHALGKVPLLSQILNRGPYPVDGDFNTVPQASYDPAQPFDCSVAIVSWRYVADCADFDHALSVMPPGESGQAASPHADDQLTPWLSFDYHQMPFVADTVKKHAKKILRLKPAKY